MTLDLQPTILAVLKFELEERVLKSAKVGMLAKCKDKPKVQSMISCANAIMGYDLLEAGRSIP